MWRWQPLSWEASWRYYSGVSSPPLGILRFCTWLALSGGREKSLISLPLKILWEELFRSMGIYDDLTCWIGQMAFDIDMVGRLSWLILHQETRNVPGSTLPIKRGIPALQEPVDDISQPATMSLDRTNARFRWQPVHKRFALEQLRHPERSPPQYETWLAHFGDRKRGRNWPWFFIVYSCGKPLIYLELPPSCFFRYVRWYSVFKVVGMMNMRSKVDSVTGSTHRGSNLQIHNTAIYGM